MIFQEAGGFIGFPVISVNDDLFEMAELSRFAYSVIHSVCIA